MAENVNIPSGQDVSPEEAGNPSVSEPQGTNLEGSQDPFVQQINEATGRTYKNVEEAVKGMKETYSFVGQLGNLKEKAQAYDSLQKVKKTAQEEINERYEKVDKMEFLHNNPDAKNVADDVLSISKTKGISMQEAYDNSSLKRLVEVDKKEQEASQPSVIASGQRLPQGQLGINLEEFSKLPMVEQKKLLDKLGMGKGVLPKGKFDSRPLA